MSHDANDDDATQPGDAHGMATLRPLLEGLSDDGAARLLEQVSALVALVPILEKMPETAVDALAEQLEASDEATRGEWVDHLLAVAEDDTR